MTPTKIQTTIAEIMGWTNVKEQIDPYRPNDPTMIGIKPEYPDYPNPAKYAVPDYPASLDACAEFEKILTEQQNIEYVGILEEVTTEADDPVFLIKLIKATPLQRCEAFLRLHGKWEEGD